MVEMRSNNNKIKSWILWTKISLSQETGNYLLNAIFIMPKKNQDSFRFLFQNRNKNNRFVLNGNKIFSKILWRVLKYLNIFDKSVLFLNRKCILEANIWYIIFTTKSCLYYWLEISKTFHSLFLTHQCNWNNYLF
jgi:hypothetical protein